MEVSNTHTADGRKRRDAIVPSGVKVRPRAWDIAKFEFLHTHNYATSSELIEYTRYVLPEAATNYDASIARLSLITHETRAAYRSIKTGKDTRFKTPFLERPAFQQMSIFKMTNDAIYANTDPSKFVLNDLDKLSKDTVGKSSSPYHDFLISRMTNPIHLGCLRQPNLFEFHPHQEVVAEIGRSTFPIPMNHDGKAYNAVLRPDALCEIDYLPNDKSIISGIEADGSTEQGRITAKSGQWRKTLQGNFELWHRFINGKLYKQYFGEDSSFMLLYCFNNAGAMKNAMQICDEVTGGKSHAFLFKLIPDAEDVKRIKVNGVNYEFFTEPFNRAGKPPFSIYNVA